MHAAAVLIAADRLHGSLFTAQLLLTERKKAARSPASAPMGSIISLIFRIGPDLETAETGDAAAVTTLLKRLSCRLLALNILFDIQFAIFVVMCIWQGFLVGGFWLDTILGGAVGGVLFLDWLLVRLVLSTGRKCLMFEAAGLLWTTVPCALGHVGYMLYDYFNEHEVNLFIILVHTVYAVLLIVPSCVAYGLVMLRVARRADALQLGAGTDPALMNAGGGAAAPRSDDAAGKIELRINR